MFGTRIRSWMEAHIVARARKKQSRLNKNKAKEPPALPIEEDEKREELKPVTKEDSAYSVTGGGQEAGAGGGGTEAKTGGGVVSLSSPESAYSTGYSTDGTSPGASLPPEYYINLRTGKHYVQAGTGNAGASSIGGGGGPAEGGKAGGGGTPSRRRREDRWRTEEGLPGSSTEEDIADRVAKASHQVRLTSPKVQKKGGGPVHQNDNLLQVFQQQHRRTESYDESQRFVFQSVERDSEGSSSTTQTTGGAPSISGCGSPYPAASPRQRNRIRTNPWLGGDKVKAAGAGGGGSPAAVPPFGGGGGETSSTVGSSSTLSSSGGPPPPPLSLRPSVQPQPPPVPPRPTSDEVKNLNLLRNGGAFVPSPLLCGGRRAGGGGPGEAVTTCSPLPNRPCRHIAGGAGAAGRSKGDSGGGLSDGAAGAGGEASSSSTSARSSASGGNTSDFSEDDLTLNELLGRYDESYVYDKETDILSDSDPTDCDDRYNYNGSISSRQASERQDDLDFIDTGSIAELAYSESEETGRFVNRGHCTFVSSANHTPEMCKRQCSRLRRHRDATAPSRGSSVGSRRVRRNSSRRSEDSETTPTKRYRRKRQTSRESRRSGDSGAELPPPALTTRGVALRSPRPELPTAGGALPPGEPGRHLNLNRVLMERLIQNQRSGTRSADGTPVSLRRHATEYNGKYLKNPHVSKLISTNSLLEKRSPSPDKEENQETSTIKKRSNSVCTGPTPPPVPARTYVKNPNPIDKEGDMQYRKLIREAENIFEDFHIRTGKPDYLSPTLSTRSAIFPAPRPPPQPYMFSRIPNEAEINSQIDLLQETINNNSVPKLENEEGILKTISKTLEKIIIRNSDTKKSEKTDTVKSKKGKHQNKSGQINGNQEKSPHLSVFNDKESKRVLHGNDYVNNTIPVSLDALPDSNDNLYKDYTYTPPINVENAKSFNENLNSNYAHGFRTHKKGVAADPPIRSFEAGYPIPSSPRLIPTNKKNKTKDLSSSWHGRRAMAEMMNANGNEMPYSGRLASFKSFELGNRVDTNAKYCPQSEPVKRKVYRCSSTFDKLQKSLLRDSSERQYQPPDLPTEELRDENTSLKEKVARLRRERLQVEARVRETQEQIDRLRLEAAASHC